jgi:hypothetical protein
MLPFSLGPSVPLKTDLSLSMTFNALAERSKSGVMIGCLIYVASRCDDFNHEAETISFDSIFQRAKATQTVSCLGGCGLMRVFIGCVFTVQSQQTRPVVSTA